MAPRQTSANLYLQSQLVRRSTFDGHVSKLKLKFKFKDFCLPSNPFFSKRWTNGSSEILLAENEKNSFEFQEHCLDFLSRVKNAIHHSIN